MKDLLLLVGVAMPFLFSFTASAEVLKPVGAAGILPAGLIEPRNPIGAFVPDQGLWQAVVEFDLGIIAGPGRTADPIAVRSDLTNAVKKILAAKHRYLALRFSPTGFDPKNPSTAGRSVHQCRLTVLAPASHPSAASRLGLQPDGAWLVSNDPTAADHCQPDRPGTLAWTLDQIGTDPATIQLPGGTVLYLKDNLTVPANVHLRFNHGGVLHIAAGKTLTLNGIIDAGPFLIFAGPGRIGGELKVCAVLPAWFGTKADGQADDIEPLQKAVDYACTSRVLAVDLGAGRYRITKTLNCTNTREAGTIHRDGLRIFGSSLTGTQIIGDTGDHHAIIETSGAQWLELDRFTLSAGAENPSSVGIFSGCPKACPQSQNQIYHVSIALNDAIKQNGGLGSIGIWNYAAEEHTYRSVYIHANRPVVLWAFNGEKPDAPDAKGMFNYRNSYITLLNAPHSLGVVTFSGECFLLALGKHAPVVTSHCANSLAMHNTYMGSGAGTGANTCAFDIYGSLTNLTYSGTVEGLATFARVNGLLIGSRVSATYGLVGEAQRTGLLYGSQKGAMNGKAPLLELGPDGRIENCDFTFSPEAQKSRPILGLLKPAGDKSPTARLANTTVKTSQPDEAFELPDALRSRSVNLILSNQSRKFIINPRE